ncbi:MAG: hypothetical protein AB7S68_17370 [Polyangiaceae bacterium]
MRFYGIVNQLRQDAGVYGRAVPDEAAGAVAKAIEGAAWKADAASALAAIAITPTPALTVAALGGLAARIFQRTKRPFAKLQAFDSEEHPAMMIIPDRYLDGDYSLSEEDGKVLHGLISDRGQFKRLMSAEGGSELFIMERTEIAALGLKHFGGDLASFSPGLYCEHPKDTSVLLPLGSADQVLESEILEEIMSVFEALGATRITIEELTEYRGAVDVQEPDVKVRSNASASRRVLREKRFEPLGIDLERADNLRKHVHDLRDVAGIIEARRHGNEVYEHCEQLVEINCGLTVDVLGAFSTAAESSYRRRWSLEVEFISKSAVG